MITLRVPLCASVSLCVPLRASLAVTSPSPRSQLLEGHMPTVSYLRLDGKVAAPDRFALAERFNADASIDLMLLTTSVGGLGLTLTGADVVIFLDHDWNPMKDLQVRRMPLIKFQLHVPLSASECL